MAQETLAHIAAIVVLAVSIITLFMVSPTLAIFFSLMTMAYSQRRDR